MSLADLSSAARKEKYEDYFGLYERMKQLELKLDLSRGKPSMAQLDWVSECFQANPLMNYISEDGTDVRNYGQPEGIIEARRLMAELAGTSVEHVIATGSSSLELMYLTFHFLMQHPLPGETLSWGEKGTVKVLCPTPGYDRHFQVAESFGAELIPVPMRHDGPDMDEVEALLRSDSDIRAMWIVPKYSNPTGTVYSDRVLKRLAAMDAPDDFVILCDQAYGMHPVLDEFAPEQPDILSLCTSKGHPNRAIVFCSTSKITYASAGLSAIALNPELRSWWLKHMSACSIGPNKVNQLQHVQVIQGMGGLRQVMRHHQHFLAPRFRTVLDILSERLDHLDYATWSQGEGGYFISFKGYPGTAKRTVQLASEAGVVLTPAGATHPYSNDPEDCYIRLAPTYPPFETLKPAMEIFCLASTLATLEAMGIDA